MGIILVDLQKAFDATQYNILLLKLSSLGFLREVIDWCKSYLSNGKLHINVHDKFSTSADLWYWLPQGFVLGPLLLLLFTNLYMFVILT